MNYRINKNIKEMIEEGYSLTQSFIKSRGIDDFDHYLSLKSDVLISNSKLSNMSTAVSLFFKSFNNKEKIGVLIDSDVDGFCSAAMMYSYIKKLDQSYPIEYIHHNVSKAHGLDDITLNDDINLLIIPDAGSNDVDECKALSKKGVNTIILDHHKIEKNNEYAVIVNNQMSDEYNNKQLCGAGVVYKFLQELDKKFKVEYADYFLDLVALANISDNMDIRSFETKYLIEQGLNHITNKLFVQFVNSTLDGLIEKITIHNIQWSITPLINGCVRFGSEEDKDILFKAFIEADDEYEYNKRATKNSPAKLIIEDVFERAVRLCKNSKGRQDRARDKATEALSAIIEKSETPDNVIIIDTTEIMEHSLTGVVAIRLSEKYQRPCILLSKREDGTYGGSMRVADNVPVNNLMSLINSCESWNFCQGHLRAAGVGININNLESGKIELSKKLDDVVYDDTIDVDFEIDGNDNIFAFIKELTDLEKFIGTGISAPIIKVNNIDVNKASVEVKGKDNNSLIFTYNDIRYAYFKAPKQDEFLIWVTNDWDTNIANIDIIGSPSVNDFDGVKTLQVIIDDYKINYTESNEDLDDDNEIVTDDEFDW